ncbi:isochorismatase family cysteine hydrolase [Hymenobacter antarcticus]|uniref:Isochorismatase-like domain-containing protein n=1 Tax=Hymenobacter antarcticus TaxID=486270 RepID=A0ABP7Q5T9_9BACT
MEHHTRPTTGPATYLPKAETGRTLPADRTVLLVIDPVNDFLSEGGAAWEMTKGTVEKNNVIPNLKRAIDGARSQGIPVLFGPMAYTEEDYALHNLQKRSGINRLMFENKMFLAGSWGADFHPEIQPQAQDIVLLPHKSCDVFQTDLAEHLESRGITHLVIAGMTANLCCESTGRHGTEAGYDVTFLSDAIGAAGLPEYEAAIHINFPLISNGVITVDDFLASIEHSPVPAIEAGDTVHGSDDAEIGNVKKVVNDGDGPGYLVVGQGLLKSDVYVPLDAVVRRSGTDVFINLPTLIVGKMPWTEPPTAATTSAKQGPPAAAVEKLYGSYAPTGRA